MSNQQNSVNQSQDIADHADIITENKKIGTRRHFLKYGLGASVAALAGSQQAQADHLDIANEEPFIVEDGEPSPPIIPWQEAIPAYMVQPKPTLNSLTPPPQQFSNIAAGECGRNPVQKFDPFFTNPNNIDYYELHLKETLHTFNPAYPPQPIWGYDGTYPGPTFHARYGRPVVVRVFNELPQDHVGYGSPESAMHLHNLHTSSESDGFPGDYFSPEKVGPTLGDQIDANRAVPGQFKDHFYHMVYAGLDDARATDPNAIGDPREALGSLWYHDHTEDATAPNVVKGELGAFFLYDEIDSGNENDTNPNALKLPSGEFDVPLMLNDMRFDRNGFQVFDQLDSDGTFGDMIVINGKIKPFFNVARRRYRLRLYNSGPSREYRLSIMQGSQPQPYTYIANDGNLLERPLMNETAVHITVAERADIIIDFADYPLGTELYLTNFLDMDDTRKHDGILDNDQGIEVLKFIVDREADTPDNSAVLNANSFLRALPPIDLNKVVRRRTFEFDRTGGVWVTNDKIFDVFNAEFNSRKGTAEIWRLVNGSGGWAHPIHIHMEEGRILSVNDRQPPPHMRGRKDVYDLQPGYEMEIFIQFRDFNGKYVMHCHNVIHEDHAMMLRFDVLGDEEEIIEENPNNIPPTVTLAAPVANIGNKSGYIEATTTATNATITRVEFYNNGQSLITTANTAPYRANWHNAPDGRYLITAKAYDSNGLVSTSNAVNIIVDSNAGNTNEKPYIVLKNPSTSPDKTSGFIDAIAHDKDGNIVKIDFFVNGALFSTATAAPYRMQWENAPRGSYQVTAKAYDNNGAIGTSNTIKVNIP